MGGRGGRGQGRGHVGGGHHGGGRLALPAGAAAAMVPPEIDRIRRLNVVLGQLLPLQAEATDALAASRANAPDGVVDPRDAVALEATLARYAAEVTEAVDVVRLARACALGDAAATVRAKMLAPLLEVVGKVEEAWHALRDLDASTTATTLRVLAGGDGTSGATDDARVGAP